MRKPSNSGTAIQPNPVKNELGSIRERKRGSCRGIRLRPENPSKLENENSESARRDEKSGILDCAFLLRYALFDRCFTGSVVPGAGAFEIAAHAALVESKKSVKGKARLGVQAFADALLIIPKTLARNSGFDSQETMVKLQEEYADSKTPVGVDLSSGEALNPADAGIWDNYRVKRQLLNSCTVIAGNLLLVDEIMRAGMSSLKG